MLTPHGYPEDALPRIRPTIGRIEKLIWRDVGEPLEVLATEPTREMLTFAEGSARPTAPLGAPPVHWGMMFDQRWCRVTLPRAASAGDWVHWAGQGETTVYVDGVPIGGTDQSREHVRLPEGASEVWLECVAENLGIWTDTPEALDPYGCRFDGCALARRDDRAWRAWVDLGVLGDVLALEHRAVGGEAFPALTWGQREPLNRATPRFRWLVARLDDAISAFERGGVEPLATALDRIIEEMRGADPFFEVTLTGHAHIDLVWRWPERVAEFKAVHTFSNVLALMDRFPELIFGYSQPASYEAVERRSPALMERVRARIGDRRWEPDGIAYVESDTQLPCGEALARSFLIGQRGFEALRGGPSPTLWLPDVFGYAACVPQVIAESGGRSFFTTKAHWSDTNRFPHALFRWRGCDGTEIPAYITGRFLDYNGPATPERVTESALQQRQAHILGRSLDPSGFGDGGGGPTEEVCRRAEVIRDLGGLPSVRWGRIDEFFEDVHRVRDRLPVWSGEIYMEYHRGVQTSGSELKACFRAAERALQAHEAAGAVTGSGPIDEHAWKRLIFAQFHDYIPGSSCGEVYAEAIPELRALAREAEERATNLLNSNGEACLFNPLAIPRRVMVDGEMHELGPVSGATRESSRVGAEVCTATEGEIRSDRVRATIDSNGLVSSLEIDGTPIALHAPACGVVAFGDLPHAFEAWDIDRMSLERPLDGQRGATVRVESSDGAEAVVAAQTTVGRRTHLVTRYRVVSGEPVLRVEYEIDTDETDTLFKAVVPTDYLGHTARYGGPFASSERGQLPGTRQNDAAFEVPGSRWASVCDGAQREGLAVVTEHTYGFGCEAGLMHVSLVRTTLVTHAGLQGSLRRDDRGPSHFDLGKTVTRLAIARAGAEVPWVDQPAVLAETLFGPVVAYTGTPVSGPIRRIEADPGVVTAWIKPADDHPGAIVVRAHETHGRPGTLRLELSDGWTASTTDLRERPLSPQAHTQRGACEVPVRANAFVSVMLAPSESD